MAMIIDVAPEVELKIRSLAALQGMSPESYLSDLVETNVRKGRPNERTMPANEKILLQQINVGLSQVQWERYHALLSKRDARNLTEEEHQELLQIINSIEILNARRIEALAELAQLRRKPIRTVMAELGITPPSYG